MKAFTYNTQDDADAITCGTSGQGAIKCNYKTLVRLYGKPYSGSADGKTDAEWVIQYMDGKVATIYNWKNGRAYAGSRGKDVADITDWSIGGNHFEVARRIAREVMHYER